MRVTGKCALVTGAARRDSIGRAIACVLAEEGADIVVNDFGREDEARELIGEIAGFGRKASFVNADVTNVDECRRLVTEAYAAFGRIDILVNNAGYSTDLQLEKIEEKDFDLMLNLHLKGTFFIIQAAIPLMTAGGRIINISSEQAYIGHRTLPHYSAAKAGMLTMTRSLAAALAPAVRQ